MTSKTSALPTCAWCNQNIDYMEAVLGVSYQIEQFNRDDSVSVIRSDNLVTLCGTCGNCLDTDGLYRAIADGTFRMKDPDRGSKR